jgi:hypothetical protein
MSGKLILPNLNQNGKKRLIKPAKNTLSADLGTVLRKESALNKSPFKSQASNELSKSKTNILSNLKVIFHFIRSLI